jgi:two-component system response regulator GlrR
VGAFERSYLERLLTASGGNITRAAEVAQKNRRALFELIRKHGVDAESFRA